jgi:hypothetical protein
VPHGRSAWVRKISSSRGFLLFSCPLCVLHRTWFFVFIVLHFKVEVEYVSLICWPRVLTFNFIPENKLFSTL